MNDALLNPKNLLNLLKQRMPFGKYAGRRLVELPETYVIWFSKKGFPEGELGDQLRAVYEIKVNGLEPLLQPLLDRLSNESDQSSTPPRIIFATLK